MRMSSRCVFKSVVTLSHGDGKAGDLHHLSATYSGKNPLEGSSHWHSNQTLGFFPHATSFEQRFSNWDIFQTDQLT